MLEPGSGCSLLTRTLDMIQRGVVVLCLYVLMAADYLRLFVLRVLCSVNRPLLLRNCV